MQQSVHAGNSGWGNSNTAGHQPTAGLGCGQGSYQYGSYPYPGAYYNGLPQVWFAGCGCCCRCRQGWQGYYPLWQQATFGWGSALGAGGGALGGRGNTAYLY